MVHWVVLTMDGHWTVDEPLRRLISPPFLSLQEFFSRSRTFVSIDWIVTRATGPFVL